jgi:hypothetical protein
VVEVALCFDYLGEVSVNYPRNETDPTNQVWTEKITAILFFISLQKHDHILAPFNSEANKMWFQIFKTIRTMHFSKIFFKL